MTDLLTPFLTAYEQFVSPFITFGAAGLWLSIHIIMQGVKGLTRGVNGKWKKLLNAGKHGAPYFLGIVGVLLFPVFPDRPPHEVLFAGFICGFIADKFHLAKARFLAWAKGRDGVSDDKKALYEGLEKVLT